MTPKAPLRERRAAGRPQNGDTQVCPNCNSTCEFNERYRFANAGAAPAWLCESPGCGFRILVRGAPPVLHGRALVRSARELQVGATRRMMRSRSLQARARKRIATAEDRVKRPK